MLQRKCKTKLPALVEKTSADPPPWEESNNISICTTAPHLTSKDEHSDVNKKAQALAMLERYPRKEWIRAHTDGVVEHS